jgi:hypothetical protein
MTAVYNSDMMILDKMTTINLEALWREQVAQCVENSKYANSEISPRIECMEEGLICVEVDGPTPGSNYFYKKIFQSPPAIRLPMPPSKWQKE